MTAAGMMMSQAMAGTATRRPECMWCLNTSSPSTSQYGLTRTTRVRALSGDKLRKPVASTSANSSPFLAGQPLSRGPLKKVGEVRKAFLKIAAQAADAGAAKSDAYPEETPAGGDIEESKAAGKQRLKIGIYFATWWGLNVVFNIYNKKVLNVFPFPWLTSTLSLLAGSTIMLASWALRIAEAPDVDADFWKGLAPV